MNDIDFIDFDTNLYSAIQGVSNFQLNEDQAVFNAYCELRNLLIERVENE